MPRRPRLALLPLLLLGALACDSATDEAGNAPDVRGSWTIVATRTNPPGRYEGVLTVERQTGGAFSGTLELAEEDAAGNLDRIAGVVSGRVTSGGALDFDAFFAAAPRRHIGRVSADSMSGSWAETTQPPATGSFNARRTGS